MTPPVSLSSRLPLRDAYTHEAADPDCLEPATAGRLLRDAPWQRLVVLGDSVAAGIREPVPGYRDVSFADRFAQALAAARPDLAYENLGVRDLRLTAIREGQVAAALGLRPDLAIVAAGGNDALARSFDPDHIRHELRQITAPLAQAGSLVVTIGLFDLARSGLIAPSIAPTMIERFDRLDAITAAVAAEVGGLHVDTHHHPRSADPAIFAGDRIHANARGHAIAFAAIVHALSVRPARVSPRRAG